MNGTVEKVFYLCSLALGSWVAKTLLDHGQIPLELLFSSVEVHSYDEAYNYLLYWLMKQKFDADKNRLMAITSLTSGQEGAYSDDNKDNDGAEDDPIEVEDDAEYKASLANTRPLLWAPSPGTHWFRYRGRCLALTREMEEHRQAVFMRTEKLRISCFGRDPSILKELMEEARMAFSQKEKGRTVIYRGVKQAYDGEFTWKRSTSRPARPLSTIILCESVKMRFIEDIQHYLHPRTMRWYSDRGIPYRRGYLFHGPPGTGKSSLAFAAAGFLGLNVYMINLNSQQLTEDNLTQLFLSLPRRCLVLLEDIDANEVTSSRTSGAHRRKGKSGISLSSLLNIIDGVAAQEGRVLVMTTNHHEYLDPALIRPGRVDYRLEFQLSSRELNTAMFRNIFREFASVAEIANSQISVEAETKGSPHYSRSDLLSAKGSMTDELRELAEAFAEKIPPSTFSPAEVQGYLLRYPDSPHGAVADVETWIESSLAEKALKAHQLDNAEAEARSDESTEDEDGNESDMDKEA
ncbi:mitochondrial chaperone bcs1 [Aspergillus floccosus]